MMSTYSGWVQVRCNSVCRRPSSSLTHLAISCSSSVESAFASNITASLFHEIESPRSFVNNTLPVKLPPGGVVREGPPPHGHSHACLEDLK